MIAYLVEAYCIVTTIAMLCVFASSRFDLLKSPPMSRGDLVALTLLLLSPVVWAVVIVSSAATFTRAQAAARGR